MTLATSGAIAAAASQSTVFVTMGADEGGGDCTSSSVTGTIFGLAVTSTNGGSGYGLTINAAGSASGQSFFRSLKIGSTVVNSADATYTSGTNTWVWGASGAALAPSTSYTLQFFR